ncbi:hypothetical protein Tco_0407725 [Tanacetum coccineum]
MMDDPNITMEEYINLQADIAQRREFEADYPAIVYNDASTSNQNVSSKPTEVAEAKIWLFHLEIKDISTLGLRDYTTQMLILPILRMKINGRWVHQIQVFNFGVLTAKMAEGLSGSMLMEHKDAQGKSIFTSRAWRWLFEVRGPLLGVAKRRMSWREFMLAMGLHTAEEMKSAGDPMLRVCHRLIACSIVGRSQAPEKVTSNDLFYLRGMDVGSVNVPYLLARYLRRFASERKRGAMISGGQFVARLAEHFELLTKQRL